MQDVKQVIIPILKKYCVPKAALFGSYSRGDFSDSSDIDLVLEPPKKMSLLGLIRVEHELEDLLGIEVDLLTYASLHPYVRDYILRDEQVLFG